MPVRSRGKSGQRFQYLRDIFKRGWRCCIQFAKAEFDDLWQLILATLQTHGQIVGNFHGDLSVVVARHFP